MYIESFEITVFCFKIPILCNAIIILISIILVDEGHYNKGQVK
jgi:hypothetical protein